MGGREGGRVGEQREGGGYWGGRERGGEVVWVGGRRRVTDQGIFLLLLHPGWDEGSGCTRRRGKEEIGGEGGKWGGRGLIGTPRAWGSGGRGE